MNDQANDTTESGCADCEYSRDDAVADLRDAAICAKYKCAYSQNSTTTSNGRTKGGYPRPLYMRERATNWPQAR